MSNITTTNKTPNRTWKHGQRVEFKGIEYTLLDRHPKRGYWWLQRVSDGAISPDFYIHAKSLTYLDEGYRNCELLPA